MSYDYNSPEALARVRQRNAHEKRFRFYGKFAVFIGIACLVALLGSVLTKGLGSLTQSYIELDVYLDEAKLDKTGERNIEAIKKVSTFGYAPLLKAAITEAFEETAVKVEGLGKKDLPNLISSQATADLREFVLANPDKIGTTQRFSFLANGRVDGYLKGRVTEESAKLDSNISPAQLKVVDALKDAGVISKKLNIWRFLTSPDASENRPEASGVGIALIGSFYMMMIVLFLALPIGVAASIYLEEFAPKNRFTDIIEVNISNLAAVPSIVFGILGLALFINTVGLPQSSPLVGGLVLTLMTLPTIIISTRAALKSVPPSIRDAAIGLGASHIQAVFHHVLPLAMPGILTGTIIGLAQALGETAPLLLIGMVAFITEFPDGITDPAVALPVQVYNWTTRADPAFAERASGAIIVLLVFLVSMNALAIFLRKKFEKKW